MGKPRKKNIAHKKPKKKTVKPVEAMTETSAAVEEAKPTKEDIKVQKETEKAYLQKQKEKKKKEHPNIFRRSVNYFKSTFVELKKVQWLDSEQLMKTSGSVAVIVAAFTGVTWIADSALGSIASLILGL